MADPHVYTLELREGPGFDGEITRPRLQDRLLRIPGLEEAAPGLYSFGEPDEHGRMEMELREGPGDSIAGMEVRIPRPWATSKGPQVWALVFMAAEWAGWEVYDPQIGDTLEKQVVLSGLVAMRQQQRGQGPAGPDELREGPGPERG